MMLIKEKTSVTNISAFQQLPAEIKKSVLIELKGKTQYGAYSMSVPGEEAVTYFTERAVMMMSLTIRPLYQRALVQAIAREPFFCSFFLVLFGDVELITYFCQAKRMITFDD